MATHSFTSHIPGFHLLLASVLIYLGLLSPSLDPQNSGFFSLETPFCIQPSPQGAPGREALSVGVQESWKDDGSTNTNSHKQPQRWGQSPPGTQIQPQTPDHPLPSSLFSPVSLTHLLQLDTTASPTMHISLIWHDFQRQQHQEEQEQWVWCTKPHLWCSGRDIPTQRGMGAEHTLPAQTFPRF